MSAPKPVVVGIADKQPTALRFAMREALSQNAPLRVLHSAGILTQAATHYVGTESNDEIRQTGEDVLADARAQLEQEPSIPEVQYVLSPHAPVRALEEEAVGAAMLVVGSDDVSWFERMVGSAIAEHVARHADAPVVVVPERAWPERLEGGVVVALDGKSAATGPLRFAFEQAGHRGNAVHVLHANPPGTTPQAADGVRASVAQILKGWRMDFPDVRVMTSFPIDEPDEACIRATEHAELVVVGRPRHLSVPFALARPIAVQLLRKAHCPVAVISADYSGA